MKYRHIALFVLTAALGGALGRADDVIPYGMSGGKSKPATLVSTSLLSGPITCDLPTGASTSALQTTGNTALASVDGKIPVLVSGRTPVDPSGVTSPVSLVSVPLATNAATAANQSTEITSLARIPAQGQALMVASTPVVIASNQTGIPVTGSFYQATQPVSGPLTDTQVRATPLPVSGTVTMIPSGTQTVSGSVSLTGTAATSSAASSQVDGHSVNIGALADASSASTLTGLLKAVKAALQGTLAVSMAAVPTGAALDATLTGGTAQTKITDGTYSATVKNSSTAAIGSDKALVVAVSPNNVVSVSTTGATAAGASASGNPVSIAGIDGSGLTRTLALNTSGQTVRAPALYFTTFSAATAGTLVHSGATILRGIYGGYSATSTTITCYNGTSASGAFVSNSLTTGQSLASLPYDLTFGTGLYCVTTGVTEAWTVAYDY